MTDPKNRRNTLAGQLTYTAATVSAETGHAAGTDNTRAGNGNPPAAVEEKKDLPCQLEQKGSGEIFAVYYTETDETGLVTENTLELLGEDRVRLTRSGALSAEFSFFVGVRTEATMVTPYGTLTLTTETDRIRLLREPEQISLTIIYRFLEAPSETHEVRYRILCGD
ncbi:MAG: DUF1934 domain-containing protein [Lachnospiraceae bacterium]|nr:DUF1934 domain-containing protein [Lachnospiraceae bacterium]